jgi:soluble lytic murein transglycosylase
MLRAIDSWRFMMKLILFIFLLWSQPLLADEAADFGAARDAFRAGNAVKLEYFAKRLKHTPLEVYTSYYQLHLLLNTADAGTIRKFLARPDDTPLIDKMRGEWLKQLGLTQHWDLFDAEYPRLLNEDVELNCYALQSRLHRQEQSVLNEVRNMWLSGKDRPGSCVPLFDAALSAGIISEQDIWQRLRLALEAGNVSLAKQLSERLNGAVSVVALDKAAANPVRYLDKLAQERMNKGHRAVILFALLRLAKQSPDLAVEHWEKISASFPAEEQHYFYGWLAYEAARKLDSRADLWFRAAGPLNEQQSAWRARIALRDMNWPEVLIVINAMKEAQQHEAVWQYWKGRALQAAGKGAEANLLFTPVSKEYNFYGQLASEELVGQSSPAAQLKMHSYKPGKQEVDAMLARPGIQRTLALYRMNMRVDAMKEWSWAIHNLNDQELIAAAEIASRNEMYDRAIVAAEKTVNVHDFSLRYLAPYRDVLSIHIRENALDEAWVYGLMRQESRFITAAKSDVGAAGLMQVMPATARWIAKRLGLKNYNRGLISQVDTNLRLGTYYMKTVLSWFDGSPVLASAAYNAGPGRARRWRGNKALEGAIYAETIPFDETRDYVKKVMSNTMYYTLMFEAPQLPLKQRMGVIAGRTPDNQQLIPDEK